VKFQLGQLVATPGCLEFCRRYGIDLLGLIARHADGDCGDMCAEDKATNDRAIATGEGRVFSSYRFHGDSVWIITEADRSSTCTLLPNEY
jgi:hypothetical protein